MSRCPTCAPGIRCLACTLDTGASFSLTYEDEEADTPVAQRRDIHREEAEAPPRAAYLDTPECPHCRGPLVSEGRPKYLHCAACGEDSRATPDQIERATTADTAWERELEGRRP